MSKCGKGCMPECRYFTTGGCISPFNCPYKVENKSITTAISTFLEDKEIARLTAENARLREEVDNLSHENDELEYKTEKLEAELSKQGRTQSYIEVLRENSSIRVLLEKFESENAELKATISKMETVEKELRARLNKEEAEHRAEVAERALKNIAERISCNICDNFNCKYNNYETYTYNTEECINWWLAQAEKELAEEERKDD